MQKNYPQYRVEVEWERLHSHCGEAGNPPCFDLFTSRSNTQLPRFAAYRPDPEAEVIDAFTFSWTGLEFYAFPPFNCVDRTLQKIVRDGATGILVVPNWPNQFWYHMYLELVIDEILLHPRLDLLYLLNDLRAHHPLHQHLGLRAALVSATSSPQMWCRIRLTIWSVPLGLTKHDLATKPI